MIRIPLSLALGACLIACQKDPPPPPPRPKSIGALHKDIRTVLETEKDDTLEIVLERRVLSGDSAVVFSIADDAIVIMRGIRTYLPAPTRRRIRFIASVPVADKYGNQGHEQVISLTFRTDDLMKINVDENRGILPSQLLNLYESVGRVHPLSGRVIRAYCGEEIAKMSQDFCRAEATR